MLARRFAERLDRTLDVDAGTLREMKGLVADRAARLDGTHLGRGAQEQVVARAAAELRGQ